MNDIERDMREVLERRRPGTRAMDAYYSNLFQSCHNDTFSYQRGMPSGLAIIPTSIDASLSEARLVNSLQKQLSDIQRDRLLMDLSFLMRNNPIANAVDYSLLQMSFRPMDMD